jgi:hypothetical protein
MVKQGYWKSKDQGHQFRYDMTRKLRDASPSELQRDSFQLDNMHAVGSALEPRHVYAGQLLLCSGGDMLESRRDSPQNTRVGGY